MMNCCPSVRAMYSPTIRALTSVDPPAANGTTIVTGRVGKACAHATRETAGSAAAPAARCRNCRRGSFTLNPPSPFTSFDHLVGESEQFVRYGEAEHPGRLVIDDQFELARLHNRQVCGVGAFEDAAGIRTKLTKRIPNVGSVAHQPTRYGIIARRICRREPMARR